MEVQTEHLQVLAQYTAQAYAMRMERLTPDTRDADMAALVHSVVKSSIKQRMKQYFSAIEAAKRERRAATGASRCCASTIHVANARHIATQIVASNGFVCRGYCVSLRCDLNLLE